jgi:hypothetical protein
MERYLEHGIPPGSFLMAVLENNLKEAFARADDISVKELPGIVAWLYNMVPIDAWGSPEICRNYMEKKRKERENT